MDHRLSRAQIAVYAALGVVLLLLGIKALRGEGATVAGAGAGSIEIDGAVPAGASGSGRGPGGGGDLLVHVAGAVREPGVYRLPAGSRVADAVERAGGPGRRGAPDLINLAAALSDGQQIVVPATAPGGVATVGAGTAGSPGAGAGASGPISLGSAGAADLEEIDGIGPVTAEKIIAFRDQNGGVGAIEELDAIPGIGPATIESLRSALQP